MLQFSSQATPDGIHLIGLSGDLDRYTSPDLLACVEDEIRRGHRRIIVDCTNLRHMTSHGLGTLLRVHARMRRQDGDVKLACVKGAVAEAVAMAHLHSVFAMYPSVEAAHEAFSSSRPAAG